MSSMKLRYFLTTEISRVTTIETSQGKRLPKKKNGNNKQARNLRRHVTAIVSKCIKLQIAERIPKMYINVLTSRRTIKTKMLTLLLKIIMSSIEIKKLYRSHSG